MHRSAGLLTVAAQLAGQVLVKPDPLEYKPSEVADQQHYRQSLRPKFHYTPIQGHVGDVTGLIYYAGEYHLFNMFDPWNQKRMAHKRWGHAVSTDLIHWKQLPGLLDKTLDIRRAAAAVAPVGTIARASDLDRTRPSSSFIPITNLAPASLSATTADAPGCATAGTR